ncbi:dienelactone hydrolase family protein [Noviherbaspirillum sp. CPCC 100848]|uniref:Dienelactone hydrolase family protein n=1 Tax=Noviherbaspirillum album TaxID=3080276 RepID=A0ABU6JH99_9BURK|nr:dienelactone hydrolase family protein [Noviherbaspirillum sp. CPCC 100848]MEC4723052.1 dienelactone hydrolase family protein [Noviherbaspirillum sp. CPCC 100848]
MNNSTLTSFAAATPPVQATLITTDAAGLQAGEIQIPAGDRDIPAYWAAPEGNGPHPVILVVQEIFGVHEHIKDVVRRFAKLGYLAIAPDLYVRQGDVSGLESIDEIRKIVFTVPDQQVMADLDASLDWAQQHGGDVSRAGVTGFCWGGRITWLYAAHQPKLKAGVAWYGKLVGDSTSLMPQHPVQLASRLKAPVLGLYGGQDQGIPLETVEQMRAALAQAGDSSSLHVYPDAPHAFYADYRPSYRKEAAEDGWRRMLDWFRQHGV